MEYSDEDDIAVEGEMTEDELQGILAGQIDDAVDYSDNTVSPSRATATKYYRGEAFGDEEDGRSQVVSMDVRDTVQSILPSLMRIFTSSDKTVEYAPNGPEDVAAAEQASDYANYIVNRDNPGFLVMYSAFKDALIRKVGVIKAYWDDDAKISTDKLTGLDEMALSALMSDPDSDVDITESYCF